MPFEEFYNFHLTLWKVYFSDKWYGEFDVDKAAALQGWTVNDIMFDVSRHKLEVS